MSGTVEGNFIGTDIAGAAALPNGTQVPAHSSDPGLYLAVFDVGQLGGASDVVSRGVCDLACNLISGNANGGVAEEVGSYHAAGDFVQGNLIGTGIDGHRLPNSGPGIESFNSQATVRVGGNGDLGNSISGNTGPAIEITHGRSPLIEGNSITGNTDGIALRHGTTAPPPPQISSLTSGPQPGQLTITGTAPYHSTNTSSFATRIDIYGDTTCEAGPQGKVPLGSVTAKTANILNSSWTFTWSPVLASLKYFTATSTVDGSTSTFSDCAH